MYQSSKVPQRDAQQETAVQMNIRLSDALRKRIEHARVDRGESLSEFMTCALETYLPMIEGTDASDTSTKADAAGGRQSSGTTSKGK